MSGRNFARSAWKKYGFKEMDGHPAPFRMFGNRIKAVLDDKKAIVQSKVKVKFSQGAAHVALIWLTVTLVGFLSTPV